MLQSLFLKLIGERLLQRETICLEVEMMTQVSLRKSHKQIHNKLLITLINSLLLLMGSLEVLILEMMIIMDSQRIQN